MTVSDLISEAAGRGISDLGLTDHIHTPYNLPDITRSRDEFLANAPGPRFHFGVEASCVSEWEIDEVATGRHDQPVYGLRSGGKPGCPLAIGITPEDIARFGIEYVVGGTHWPMYVPLERRAVIRDYHRQNMFLATHPLVDIVAHPWWWMGHWMDNDGHYPAEPWFDDFKIVPRTMHQEFAAAVVEHNSAVEINIKAILLNESYPKRFSSQYLEYLAELKSHGVRFSIASDCHAAHYAIDFERAARMLEGAGITDTFWCLPPRSRC
jgi:histidinol phosphatase-like PHP family hydrolase